MKPRNQAVRKIAPAVAIVGVLAAFSVSGAANAASSDVRSAANQDVADASYDPYEFAAQLIAKHRAEDRLGGLIQMSVSASGRAALVIPWVGEVPRWLQVGTDAIARETGAEVSISAAVNTQAELMSVAAELHATLPEDVQTSTSISIGVDALIVRGPSVPSELRSVPGESADTWGEFSTEASELTADSIRISFEVDETVPQAAARTGDQTAFRGGSSYYTSTPSGNLSCTMGFPAQQGSAMMVLTAAHCSQYLDSRVAYTANSSGGVGAAVGVTDYVWELQDLEPPYDLGLVRLNSGLTNLPSVYADPMFSTVTVRGTSSGMPAGGQYCSSGNVTKAKCNLLTESQEYVCYSNAPYPNECQYVIRVVSTNGAAVFCKGDSGGPIYYHHLGLGSPNVIAAGIISGILAPQGASCGTTGFASVVASAIAKVPNLQIRYQP